MTPELARAALAFLGRCDLKGVETETFLAVCHALRAIIEPLPQKTVAAEIESV